MTIDSPKRHLTIVIPSEARDPYTRQVLGVIEMLRCAQHDKLSMTS
jgi:hypothetical protein